MLALRNASHTHHEVFEVEALASTDSVHMCIPQHIASQLRLDEYDKKEATLADGSKPLVPYVGPLEIRFKDRVGFCGALVTGDQVVLGLIPLQTMDLVVPPKDRKIDVNPANPNIASSIVM